MSKSKAYNDKTKVVDNCTLITKDITVPYGKHTIGVDATNKKGNIISNRPTITITNTKKPKKKPNLYLLTLSVTDYKDDRLDLTYPNHDANEVVKELKKIGEPTVFEHVYPYSLQDEDVTINKIKETIEKISTKIGVEDVFVLYISGHGESNDDGDYYFIPYDCPKGADVTKRAISQAEFKKMIGQIQAVKSVVLLDTCKSGGMASKDLVKTSVKRFGDNVGSMIIAGTSSQKNAQDGYKEHGIFTYTLLGAMRDEDLYFRKRLTVSDIAKYIRKILPELSEKELSYRQEPTIYTNGDTTFEIGAWR
jgi:hypothetical protein